MKLVVRWHPHAQGIAQARSGLVWLFTSDRVLLRWWATDGLIVRFFSAGHCVGSYLSDFLELNKRKRTSLCEETSPWRLERAVLPDHYALWLPPRSAVQLGFHLRATVASSRSRDQILAFIQHQTVAVLRGLPVPAAWLGIWDEPM